MQHRENEIKLRMDASRARVAARLRSLGARIHLPRHFEDNYVLDDRSRSITRSGSIFRVRLTSAGATLTYKGPRRIVRGTKSRLELETAVPDGTNLLRLLERIGLLCRFRYQKYRTVYRRGSLLITMDETPIGDYIEIEGSADGIANFSKELGFDRDDFITRTYYELFLSYRRANRLRSKDMVFGIQA